MPTRTPRSRPNLGRLSHLSEFGALLDVLAQLARVGRCQPADVLPPAAAHDPLRLAAVVEGDPDDRHPTIVERTTGLEPVPPAWKAGTLPT